MAVDENADQPSNLIYLHLGDNTAVYEEELALADGKTTKVLWKDVLVEGTYPMSPGPGGAVDEPMTVVFDGESDFKTKTISMSDLVKSHEDGAFKYVTVPTTHKDGVLDNTGYVPSPNGVIKSTAEKPGVRIIERDGKKVFQTALAFTEPDVRGKVERGTIPDCSGGIFFNWLNKATKKKYRAAMKHVALTPVPFMGNLNPFPANFLSDEGYENVEGITAEVYNFAEGDPAPTGDPAPDPVKTGDTAEIVWKEEKGFRFIQNALNTALNPQQTAEPSADTPFQPRATYYVQDISDDGAALVEEYFKGENKRFVIPFERKDDGTVSVSPSIRWVEVREAMIAASDEGFEDMASANVLDKLSVKLSEQLGKTDSVYRVTEVTLDNRARIVNKAKKKEWVARFAFLADDTLWIEPADKWKAIEASDEPDPGVQQPAPAPVVNMSDSSLATDRLKAARQSRRQLLSS